MPEPRYTLPGTDLPQKGPLPPALLFHRWQAYDRFRQEGQLKAFKRDSVRVDFLKLVAATAQSACKADYGVWHQRFATACDSVDAEPPMHATTLWRLVVGWGTNPAFETGITLDHLLGFPFIPGSAVKGLLHRVAEQELLETVDGAAAIPTAPEDFPVEPPSDLEDALVRARRIRALFGSLHLRRRPDKASDPDAPYDRLAAWRNLLPDPLPEAWTEIRRQLVRLCSDAPAGGTVTCFDAVPDPKTFVGKQEPVLTPDVLTPHPLDPEDKKGPNPIPFLAVRDLVTFELRYRLAAWPKPDPRDHRDSEESERATDLGGIDRQTVARQLQRWLVRGLAELGLGGKTAAGYGYLLAEGTELPQPKPLAREESLSESERLARTALPDDILEDRAVAILDRTLREAEPALQAAVAARFMELFPDALERWRPIQRTATRRRVEAMDRLLGRRGEDEP